MTEQKTPDELRNLGFDSQKNYEKHIAGKIARGMKWSKVKKDSEYENDVEKLKWINSQENIVEDIKFYEDSLKPVEVVEEETKTKSKKAK